MRLPDCPSCGDNRAVHEEAERNYWCTFCKVAFDGDLADDAYDREEDDVL